MKKVLGFVLIVCLGACLARAQRAADAESKVLALERLWAEGAQLRDIKALDSIFDESIVYVPIDGRMMTKAEVLAETKALPSVEIVVSSEVAQADGNAVIVTGVLRLTGVQNGKSYVRRGRFVDTWILKQGHWLCISSMSVPLER